MSEADTHEVRFVPTWQDTLAAHRLWHRGRRLHEAGTALCISAVFMFVLVMNTGVSASSVAALGLCGFAGVLGAMWGIQTFITPGRVRARHRREARLHEGRTWRWNAEELAIRSESFASRIGWRAVPLVRQDGVSVLVYGSDKSYVFLPMRVLSAAQWACLLACLPVGKVK